MNSSNLPFQLLSESNITDVIEQLKNNLPESYHVLCFVLNVLDLKTSLPGSERSIYAPNGDYSDATLLIYLKFANISVGTYYSITDNGCTRLANALAATNMFQGLDSLLMTAVHDRVHKNVGTDWCKLDVEEITPCNLYWISAEDALKLNPVIPDDVEVRNLRVEDAELVDALWPHRWNESIHFIKKIIQWSPSVGLYSKTDGKLLSWVLKWFYGGLGLLQTVDEAKRKGYAQIVVAALSARFATDNWPIHATVLVNNNASTPLFEKMGFHRQFVCHYIDFHLKSS